MKYLLSRLSLIRKKTNTNTKIVKKNAVSMNRVEFSNVYILCFLPSLCLLKTAHENMMKQFLEKLFFFFA